MIFNKSEFILLIFITEQVTIASSSLLPFFLQTLL